MPDTVAEQALPRPKAGDPIVLGPTAEALRLAELLDRIERERGADAA